MNGWMRNLIITEDTIRSRKHVVKNSHVVQEAVGRMLCDQPRATTCTYVTGYAERGRSQILHDELIFCQLML